MSLQAGSSTQLVAQPTDTSCWAASIAMLVDKTVQEVCETAGMQVDGEYGWDDIWRAAYTFGLTEIGSASGGPDYFAPLLERSPLWIVEKGAPYHAVVLTGLYTDRDEWDPDNARVIINNPWPPGSGNVEDKPFLEFSNDYELGSGAKANIISK